MMKGKPLDLRLGDFEMVRSPIPPQIDPTTSGSPDKEAQFFDRHEMHAREVEWQFLEGRV